MTVKRMAAALIAVPHAEPLRAADTIPDEHHEVIGTGGEARSASVGDRELRRIRASGRAAPTAAASVADWRLLRVVIVLGPR